MKKNLFDTTRIFLTAAVGLLGLLVSGWAGHAIAAQGDAVKGSAVFATHCAECHSLKEGKDKKGPSLFHVFGAKAARREGFIYSEAMRASQFTWDADTLAKYVASPKKSLPGGKMKYDGLESESERIDLIAFLASQSSK